MLMISDYSTNIGLVLILPENRTKIIIKKLIFVTKKGNN